MHTGQVLEFGGALSGEHGDGLARSEWNKKMFGDVVYEAFRQVKRAFDLNGYVGILYLLVLAAAIYGR